MANDQYRGTIQANHEALVADLRRPPGRLRRLWAWLMQPVSPCDHDTPSWPVKTEVGRSIFPRFDLSHPLPSGTAPPKPPSGGPTETPAPHSLLIPPLATQIATALDDLDVAEDPPIIVYMSQDSYRALRNERFWYGVVFRDRRELARRVTPVELEIRIRRVMRDEA